MKNVGDEGARGAFDQPFSHFTCSMNLVDFCIIVSLLPQPPARLLGPWMRHGLDQRILREAWLSRDGDRPPCGPHPGRRADRVLPGVRVFDPAALASAVNRLLGDADLRARLGAAGWQRIACEFSIARMVDKTLDVYSAVLDA